jgi:SAM-dependent methyltransferase
LGASEHWEHVYRTRQASEVSWYRRHLERSLAFIEAAAPERDARILDVGGGASTLVDDLLGKGYRHLSVLDLSKTALRTVRDRLGASADPVVWLHGDVRTLPLEAQSVDVWHDRAVFHFLTDEADRAAYVRQVVHALKPNGHLVVFGEEFRLEAQAAEEHATPRESIQSFVYCHFMRSG